MTSGPHLTEEVFTDLVNGLLDRKRLREVDAHLDVCASCRSIVARAKQTEEPPGSELLVKKKDKLEPGALVSGYRVVRALGHGAMGRVYLATAEQGGHQVALKVVRLDAGQAMSAKEARARFLREAQVLARLDHPNVLRVYDAGVFGEQVFLALEPIDGPDGDKWARGPPRPTWREVLALYAGAGRGLSAAHTAGVIHRDFKPHNVLIDAATHTAKVADFGLARPTAGFTPSPTTPGAALLAPEPLRTATGVILGTPAYMPPEQLMGERASFASDQFSFAVSLYEALFAHRPFAGKTLKAYCDAVLSGARLPVPEGTQVPREVVDVLHRALCTEPTERWPSMDALLDALRVCSLP